MKINKLKINAFGKLQEKEIEFSNNINIVYGQNESGKSTLIKFISNMFYGTSKNKKGKKYSDYDLYKPWNSGEFSGKIEYSLDNGKKFEVFREFGGKKNPKIYNEQKEDISREYTIDKTNGNMFFTEQTGVDESTFLSTIVSMQQEVKIDQNTQNLLVQKVANMANTGDDNTSYKKALEKINKKQIEEIGTVRSQGRPLNIAKLKKYELQDKIGELENYKIRNQEIENEKEQKKQELNKINEKLNIIKKVKQIKENEKIEQEKIKINENIIQTQKRKQEELETRKEEIEEKILKINNDNKKEIEQKNKKIINTKKIIEILVLIVALFETVNIFAIKNNIINIVLTSAIIILFFILFFKNIKIKKEINKEIEKENNNSEKTKKLNEELEKIKVEINILQENIKFQTKKIAEIKQEIFKNEIQNKEKIKQEINSQEVENIFNNSNISYEQEKQENMQNNVSLAIHSLELEKNTIEPKLEEAATLEEEFEETCEREKQLEKDNEVIEITKEILEIAYQKMKKNVTPKLTQELSKNIQKISNGKYSKININEEKGIIVEKENGEYVEAEKLSCGTIDQLYLSLRLAILKEETSENMPVILDEAFAYYDENRLKNLLKYISVEYPQKQVIILTCTNREREILNKLHINYNSIEL